jgi:hypothetical protein
MRNTTLCYHWNSPTVRVRTEKMVAAINSMYPRRKALDLTSGKPRAREESAMTSGERPQSQAPDNTQLRPLDHMSPWESHSNPATLHIPDVGFFSGFSKRPWSFEHLFPFLGPLVLLKAKWVFFSPEHLDSGVLAMERGSSKHCKFPEFVVGAGLPGPAADIFPLWRYIHVSTFSMSDWMNIVV